MLDDIRHLGQLRAARHKTQNNVQLQWVDQYDGVTLGEREVDGNTEIIRSGMEYLLRHGVKIVDGHA